MNAAVIESFGATPRFAAFADPAADAGAGEVLVTVSAAALHPVVKSLARGAHYMSTGALPMVPGIDGVGRLEDGARVYFGAMKPPYGSFAERCATARFFCQPIPDTLDDNTVAAMMNPLMSSWGPLTGRAQFVAGESVLILGATGVAGQLAVQVARRLGAKRVVAAGRNPATLAKLPQLGADGVISLDQEAAGLIAAVTEEWARGKIDVVLDYVWGSPAERLMEAISQKGFPGAGSRIRYMQIGAMAGANISLPSATLRSTGLELMGSGFGSVSIQAIFESLARCIQAAAKEPFSMEIDAFPLREVESVWDAPSSGRRVVFRP
ncbi:MAG TPA: zinc-binding alcohol dehydrogenase family protein [Verrucomicrobiae bacterium]|jgi:NADPH:quinone reductase-like Zn-dependent oxidoreductase|nr:zinc-binding alcohol dehydrogenase family protein [Verrucomicrobiae bacterium]